MYISACETVERFYGLYINKLIVIVDLRSRSSFGWLGMLKKKILGKAFCA